MCDEKWILYDNCRSDQWFVNEAHTKATFSEKITPSIGNLWMLFIVFSSKEKPLSIEILCRTSEKAI